jgi:hypothetical protein
MADEIIIRKLSNGNVQIERSGETVHTSLNSSSDIIPQGASLYIIGYTGKQQQVDATSVEKVIRGDGTEVTISDITTLYNELSIYFFYKESDGGGGSTEGWNGSVDTYADLPTAADHNGEIYLVKTKTGSQLTFNLRRSGLYQSNGSTWSKISNAQFMFKDDELTFSDNVDNTKQLGFELGNITTGNRRVWTIQDRDGTVAYLDDIEPLLFPTLVLTCTNSIDINTVNGLTIPFSVPLRSTISGISLVNGILTLGTSGQYRMSYKIISDSNNALRKNPHTVIQKNSLVDLPLTLSTTYERNTNDATGTNALPMVDDIINMNLLGGETFNVRGYQGGSGGGAITVPSSCIWTIEKIA